MNALFIGADLHKFMEHLDDLDDPVLIIDDGPGIEGLSLRARKFDPFKHSLNPLEEISYWTASDFLSVFDRTYDSGKDTLTKQNTAIQIVTALLGRPHSFASLIRDTKETKDAYNKVQRLLLSPVLKPLLTRPPSLNFRMTGTIAARVNRAQLRTFDARFIGNYLASRYKGPVAYSDFGFYAAAFHSDLIYQGRLIAHVNSLSELPVEMRNQLLINAELYPSRTTYADAVTLADYLCQNLPHTDGWNTFISENTGKKL